MKALLLCAFFASTLATDGWLVVNEDNDHSVLRELNAIRKKYPSFLLEGKMIRPFLKCESRSATADFEGWRSGSVETTEVLTSFWENAKGERIGFASNWRREPSELKITHADGRVETRTLAPLETIELFAE